MFNKLAPLILAAFLLFSIIAPHTVSQKDVRNWNNVSYWSMNPKGVPPAWYGELRGLPKTEWLTGRYEDGKFIYTYDFHYYHAPQDILLIPNQTKSLRLIMIDPDGNRYVLWEGYIPDFVYIGKTIPNLMSIARKKCNPVPHPGTLMLHGPLNVLFVKNGRPCVNPSRKDFLQGKYTFIVEGTFGNLTKNDEPKIKVLGLSYGLMGTDIDGRDVWVGFAYGAKETVLVAFIGGAVMILLALLLGSLSVLSGKVGRAVNFISKFLTSTPALPVAVILILLTGNVVSIPGQYWYFTINPFILGAIVGILLMGNVSRNIKAIIEEELRKEHIESAKALGGNSKWILKKHVAPILMPYSLHQFALAVPGIIAFITLLGFFNVSAGVNWGSIMGGIIIRGANYRLSWWQVVPIGIALGLLAFSFLSIANEIEKRFLKG